MDFLCADEQKVTSGFKSSGNILLDHRIGFTSMSGILWMCFESLCKEFLHPIKEVLGFFHLARLLKRV